MKPTPPKYQPRKENTDMTAYRFNIDDFTTMQPGNISAANCLSEREADSTRELLSLFRSIIRQSAKEGAEVTARRLWLVLEATPLAPVAKETVPQEKKTKPREEEPELPLPIQEVEGPAKRGRKHGSGRFAGKKVYPLRKRNPRRVGTQGWKSFEIIRAREEGIPYEEFLAAGGNPADLRWDVVRKWAEVK